MISVSVIIPTFNRCEQLKRALASVYAQSRPVDEIIIVDDGSSDGTDVMVRKEFSEVRYYYQGNKGVSHARNVGLEKAMGNWIAFLDSDDEWLPGKLESQLLALKSLDTMKVCHTEEIWIRKGRRVNPMNKHKKNGGWIFQQSLALCLMSPSSILIHRSVFDDIGYFDETLPACEDYDLWLRITAKYPVLYIEDPQIIKYGGHDDQLSRKYWGMDRFRISSLKKNIANAALSQDDRTAAVNVLLEKCRIYGNGAVKRNKFQEAAYYQNIIEQYSEQ